MCGCRGKRNTPLVQQSRPAYLPGADGIILLEYRGGGDVLSFPCSLITGGRYRFDLNSHRYGYVDKKDLGRVQGFKENGKQVLFEATQPGV
jgi:hypothetical protein